MTMGELTDIEASLIAEQTYNDIDAVQARVKGKHIEWNAIETIQDKNTGLNGYIFENEDTGEIVVSFEGTQLNEGFEQAINDIREDISGIVIGGSNYTKPERNAGTYRGSPSQDARIASGSARVDQDGNFIIINENQFISADEVIKETVEKHGKNNITFVGHSLGGGLAEYFAVKYDTSAITFAAADVYDLLTVKEQKLVKSGNFRDQIISYTYPDDLVGTFYNQAIGSTYYMSNPQEITNIGLATHGMKENFRVDNLFDENGYYKAELLYDETLHRPLTRSPLEMKNSGVHGFSILIKSAILKSFALDVEKNADLIESTENAFKNFYDYYIDTMQGIKSKYQKQVGTGKYDMLSTNDVEGVFSSLGKLEGGVPILFNNDQYEEILSNLKDIKYDTAEIAHNMDKMGNDFAGIDKLLAGWLGLKL